MIRGLYTSAMGMVVQQKRQENISQNLANIETNSFKKQEMIASAFDRVVVKNKANSVDNRLTAIGDMHLGVRVDDLYTDFKQGIVEDTDEPLDFAIEGEGFFTIQLPSGDYAYTRDGSFTLNENGQLTTKQGYLVMADNLESIPLRTEDIQVDSRGMITLPNGQDFALSIVNFAQAQDLQKLGGNLYTIEGGQPIDGNAYTIRQGSLEKSNVNALDELVKMIEVTRSFESNQKAVQAMDDTLGKAVNEVGRVG